MSQNENDMSEGIAFTGLPVSTPSIIKVIGVGGGGGNAVNHMYNEGIHDVSYVVCNTDKKALSDSQVPVKLQLGEGLGAGNKPEKGRQAALDSLEDIKKMLDDGSTRMVFITAGMGGGTGTGAAPVIAQCAKDMGILTVGIVTIPFIFEGTSKIDQALDGVEELSKHVDALLVINNERLRAIYPELTIINAFAKADDTLTVAARSIAEIITMHGIMNLDFQDVTTVLKDGGVAVMSTGYAEGEHRVTKAIAEALNSPLLNNNDIFNSKKVLLNINFNDDTPEDSLKMEEMQEVHDFMTKFQQDVETKWGLATDPELGSKVKITLLATGFGLNDVADFKKVAAKEEDESKLAIRSKYYDQDPDTPKSRNRTNVFLFDKEDIDNDDLIAAVETTVAFDRNREAIKKIKDKKETQPTPTPTEAETGSQPTQQQGLSFQI